jgi:hypothetical protein
MSGSRLFEYAVGEISLVFWLNFEFFSRGGGVHCDKVLIKGAVGEEF